MHPLVQLNDHQAMVCGGERSGPGGRPEFRMKLCEIYDKNTNSSTVLMEPLCSTDDKYQKMEMVKFNNGKVYGFGGNLGKRGSLGGWTRPSREIIEYNVTANRCIPLSDVQLPDSATPLFGSVVVIEKLQ